MATDCVPLLRLILENWGKPHLTILVFSTTQIADFINRHDLMQNAYWSVARPVDTFKFLVRPGHLEYEPLNFDISSSTKNLGSRGTFWGCETSRRNYLSISCSSDSPEPEDSGQYDLSHPAPLISPVGSRLQISTRNALGLDAKNRPSVSKICYKKIDAEPKGFLASPTLLTPEESIIKVSSVRNSLIP